MADRSESEFIEAIKSPIRARILAYLSDRNGGAKEIAQHTGETVGRVRYHLRALRRAELVETVRAEARRGVHEKYVTLVTRSFVGDEAYLSLEPQERERLTKYLLRLIVEDIARFIKEPTVSDERLPHTLRVRMALDAQGWQELSDILRETLSRIEATKQRAEARLEKGDQEPFPVSVSLVSFEMPANSQGTIPLRFQDGSDLV
ncbi:MAG TPA: winged helix-turn-helix domain-containing protein [Solirubrobacterales bacterium]|nr:winged helix-turn-helix domain-containing protein [Solirubrobacterales bacterium]